MKELREELGWSQAQAASLAGVRREMWAKYEAGSEPGAKALAAIAAAGWDVVYILTGQRSGKATVSEAVYPPTLTRREAALLDNYRNSPEDAKAALDKTSAALAQSLEKGSEASLPAKAQR